MVGSFELYDLDSTGVFMFRAKGLRLGRLSLLVEDVTAGEHGDAARALEVLEATKATSAMLAWFVILLSSLALYFFCLFSQGLGGCPLPRTGAPLGQVSLSLQSRQLDFLRSVQAF